MFFVDLRELESLMHGHAVAFLQLGLVTDETGTFNASFRRWLVSTKRGSIASGWAIGIEELAGAAGVHAVSLFFEFAEEFFDSWVAG